MLIQGTLHVGDIFTRCPFGRFGRFCRYGKFDKCQQEAGRRAERMRTLKHRARRKHRLLANIFTVFMILYVFKVIFVFKILFRWYHIMTICNFTFVYICGDRLVFEVRDNIHRGRYGKQKRIKSRFCFVFDQLYLLLHTFYTYIRWQSSKCTKLFFPLQISRKGERKRRKHLIIENTM